jgi:hypothetical protein
MRCNIVGDPSLCFVSRRRDDNGRHTYHDHGRTLKDANCDKEGPCVSYCVRLGYKQHYVSAYTYYRTSNDEVATVLHLVGVISCYDDSNECCHVGRYCEQLRSRRGVAHARDDGREEECEALCLVSRSHFQGMLQAYVKRHE